MEILQYFFHALCILGCKKCPEGIQRAPGDFLVSWASSWPGCFYSAHTRVRSLKDIF